jgi:hypothetical protein
LCGEITYRFKSSDVGNPVVRGDVVNCNAAVLNQTSIGELSYSFVCAIPRFVIESRCPVVGEISTIRVSLRTIGDVGRDVTYSLKVQEVQFDLEGRSYATGVIEALKELPPTIW